MEFINDFQKILKISPYLEIPKFNKKTYYHPCSKEWLIEIKKAISASTELEKNPDFKEALESIKNLIAYFPSAKNLMLVEFEIKKVWNLYEITAASWGFLFPKSQNEIISLVTNIAKSSKEELYQKDLPFKYKNDKIKLLNSIKKHILFYRDYKKSYDIYGGYYSRENLYTFKKLLNILESYDYSYGRVREQFLNYKNTFKDTILIIKEELKNETIAKVENVLNSLGENTNGLPKWGFENLDKLIENINISSASILSSISQKLVFPTSKRNPKKMMKLCLNIAILKKVYEVLKENYFLISDFSPSLETFLDKFGNQLALSGKEDLVLKLAHMNNAVHKKYGFTIKKMQEGAEILFEAAEAFDVFASELEAENEFPLSKSWIAPDTKVCELKKHSQKLIELQAEFENLQKKQDKLKNQIKNLSYENEIIKRDKGRAQKIIIQTQNEIKNINIICEQPFNFLERFFAFFNIDYKSKKRKFYIKEIENLNMKIKMLETPIKDMDFNYMHNTKAVEKLNSKTEELKTYGFSLKAQIKTASVKMQEEKNRILEAKNYSEKLRIEATKINSRVIYHSKGHPWANGVPKIFNNCEKKPDEIVKHTKMWVYEIAAKNYEASVKEYVALGEKLISLIVAIQAYGTIYINNRENIKNNHLLFETHKKRVSIVKELDKKISSDISIISDLLNISKQNLEKILLSLDY